MYDDGTNGDAIANDSIYNVQVDLATGTEFSFAQIAPATPGNVSGNLRAWYRADRGVSGDYVAGIYISSPVAGYANYTSGGPTTQFGQSFTAETTGSFNTFSYNPNGSMAGINVVGTVYICNGDEDYATCTASPDYTQAGITVVGENGASVTSMWNTIQWSTPFAVTRGQQYTVHFNITSGSITSGILYQNSNVVSGGRAYGSGLTASHDMTFQAGEYFAAYWKDQSGNQIDVRNQGVSTQNSPVVRS
jgi:hypothetical protein